MSHRLDQISHAVMDLPPQERAKLAERIWESMTAEERADVEREWCDEVDRRIQDSEALGTLGTPAEQVLDEIEADLRSRRG